MYRSMNIKSLTVAVSALVLSTSVNAALIATNVMDNNGEWSIGNSVNQFLSPGGGSPGLTPTAGAHIMHFNSQSPLYSSPSHIEFNNLIVSAGTYTVQLDVGSFTNAQLANIDIIGLTTGGTFIDPRGNGPRPSPGSWQTWTMVSHVPNGSNLIGGSLGFTIDVASNGVNANIGFDNLRIDFQAASPVPVPAAVWLFGSGLIGLIGIARRKASA